MDDAIGEAFDKVAKILGMSYPGGPEIEKIAEKGDELAFKLPHPLIKNKDLMKKVIVFVSNKLISQIAIVGGVAANKYLYKKMIQNAKKYKCEIILPTKDMLSDNAAMIGWACIQKYKDSKYSNIKFKENPRLAIVD